MLPLSREAFNAAVQQLYDLNDQASVDTFHIPIKVPLP